MRKAKILLAITVSSVVAWVAAEGQSPNYPSGFRHWQHVKSGAWLNEHTLAGRFTGLHHVYANDKAVQGLQGEGYEDGAVLVFDLFHYSNENHVMREGARKSIDVMIRDSKRFTDTGGWGFVTFLGDEQAKPVQQDVVSECFACHKGAEKANYVFSQYRD